MNIIVLSNRAIVALYPPFYSGINVRLKRLEVFGFKSFFDKTIITFRQGITGIVGPNGCGKSNFADAIHWVLGEQSPKNLRGERMEDVIFNGTEQRKPLSVAEVSLTIGDISNELPPPYTPYAELTLSRRLYRSGESEYLINKSPCRLKDIRDLLIDIGAGYRAHTIIEQGKVDDLITASPLQRRELVEEAAGIAKYRLRKAEALRKLEATEHNLTRVRDIVGEIKRHRNALDRQARKAEQSQSMSASLKTLELQLARHEWIGWKAEQDLIEQSEAGFQKDAESLSTQLAALEMGHATNKLSMTDKEADLGVLSSQISEVEREIQRCEGKLEMIHAQDQEWHEALARTDHDMNSAGEEILSRDNELETLDKAVSEAAQILPEVESSLSEYEEKTHHLEASVHHKNTDLEQCKVTLFDLSSQLATSKNNLLHFQTRKESLLKQKKRLLLEQETIDTKCEESELSLKLLLEKNKKNSMQLTQQLEKKTRMSDLLRKTEDDCRVKGDQLSQVKEDLAGTKSQRASHEGFYRGFLEKRKGTENLLLQLQGLQGMVADLIDVSRTYELALEAVLENRLRGIVVEDHNEIKKGIAHLRDTEMGRGTFFPRLPRAIKGQRQKDSFSPGNRDEAHEGIIGFAIQLVSVRSGYETIAEALLGGIVITTDLESALESWKAYPSVGTWVTLDGEVVDQSGVVSGGERGKKGLLGQKRELQLLTEKAGRLQEKADCLQKAMDQDHSVIEETGLEVASLTEEIRCLEVSLLKDQNEQQTLRNEVDRLQGERQTILFELEEGIREEETLSESEEDEQGLIERTDQLIVEKEISLEDLKKLLDEHSMTLGHLNEEVVQLRIRANSLKENQRYTLEKRSRVCREKENLRTRLEEMSRLKQSLQEKMLRGEVEAREMKATIETLSADLAVHLEAIREKRESHAAFLSRLQEEEEALASLRSRQNQVQEALQKNALKKVSIGMNRQKIEESILATYQIEIATTQETTEDLPLEEARERAQAFQKKIEMMGPVNLAAIEEYKELDTRFQFLTAQEADLMQSMEGLREAISKINKTTRGLFIDTFHKLNQKFGEVFTAFFGGGSAELVLLDEAHPLESGIEMLAQAPGKGKRNILLLSGGEKALTAISLLFATFQIHPTPFCLLDELDAPLDEENTRRFSQALVKMSDETQFIVITHNKFTMEIADVLYGVTMEETGISKLVSVNLKSSKELGNTQVTKQAVHA